jgi:hypothetical protein
MLPRWAIWVAAASLLVVLGGSSAPVFAAPPLKVGTEVFAVDPYQVLEISYRTAAFRLVARRLDKQEPFAILFMEENRPQAAACRAGPGFQFVLKQLSSLKISRHIPEGQEKAVIGGNPLDSWPEVLIRDASRVEPFRARIMPIASSAGEALVHFHGVTYAVVLDNKVFQLIAGGCRSLSKANSP